MLPRTLSFRRYSVSGRVPDPLSDEFAEAVERTRFVPMGDDSIEEEALGWTDFDNFLDTRFDIGEHYEHGVLRLSLRTDKRVVPSSLVRAHVQLEKRAMIAAGEKISRRRVDEIKQGVIEMLRPRVLPRTQVVKALWRVRDKQLILLSTSDTPAERFATYFGNAFDHRTLTHLEPVSLVAVLEATRDRLGRVDLISVTDLRPS